LGAGSVLAIHAVTLQNLLHLVPELTIYDGVVIAGIAFVFMNNFAEIDTVLQHQIESATGKRLPSPDLASQRISDLADDPLRYIFRPRWEVS